jgi:hypothetical protein
MYQDGYCNRDGMHADKTKPGDSCKWWIGGITSGENMDECPKKIISAWKRKAGIEVADNEQM